MVGMERRDLYLKTWSRSLIVPPPVLTSSCRLLRKGHKVGLVEQLETRALKKLGENRNAPFQRDVKHIYTFATFVDELGSIDDEVAPTLMCVLEGGTTGTGAKSTITIAIVTICPTTGEIVWDRFQGRFSYCIRSEYLTLTLDTRMRTELEVLVTALVLVF